MSTPAPNGSGPSSSSQTNCAVSAFDDADAAKVTRRLVGMLARRGYSQSMAFDVVKAELAAERERRRV